MEGILAGDLETILRSELPGIIEAQHIYVVARQIVEGNALGSIIQWSSVSGPVSRHIENPNRKETLPGNTTVLIQIDNDQNQNGIRK